MAANMKSCPSLYNKINKIAVKLNDNLSAKEIKKQASEEFAHRIDIYLIESKINITKLRGA